MLEERKKPSKSYSIRFRRFLSVLSHSFRQCGDEEGGIGGGGEGGGRGEGGVGGGVVRRGEEERENWRCEKRKR